MRSLPIFAAVLLFVPGCGPSVRALAAEKRFDELVCAPSSEEDLRVAGKALHDALALSYEIIELRRADVASDDKEVDALFAKKALFAVIADGRSVGLEGDLDVVVHDGTGVALSTLRSAADVARLTDERLPDGTVTSATSIGVDTKEATSAILSLGLSRFFSGKPIVSTSTTTTEHAPSAAELAAKSPRTSAIMNGFSKRVDGHRLRLYVVDRGQPVVVGYRVTVSDAQKRCTLSIYHHGDPVSFARPKAPFSWRWNGIGRTRDGESITVSNPL